MFAQSKQVSLRRLLALIKPHWRLFSVGMIALLIAAALNLAIPALVKTFIDSKTFVSKDLLQFCLLITVVFVIQAVAFYYRTISLTNVGIKVVEDIRFKLFNAVLSQEISFFDSARIGDLTSRLTTDVQLLQDAASLRISVFIRYLVQVVCGVVLMLWLSPILGGALLLIIPFLVGLSINLGKKLKIASRAQQEAISTSASLAEESFLGIKSLRSLGIEGYFSSFFKSASHTIANCARIRTNISGIFQSGVSLLMNIALVGVVAYGMSLVSDGRMSAGSLTAFLMYGVTVAVSFAFLSTGYTELLQSLGGVERVFELIDSQLEEGNDKEAILDKNIVLRNVNFTYPTRVDSEVLKGVSLEIPFGKFIGIVGYSGSGKSTIIQLIAGFYKSFTGEVLIGGKKIQNLNRSTISNLVTLVPQDPWVFGGTLRENLVLGASISDSDLKNAINAAALDDVISVLPNGLDSQLGPRGVQLSGGQRQRIALARAILRNTPILLLDEATSALDAETESKVLQGLEQYRGDKTVVIIAHRLAAVQKTDCIFVMARGKVIEYGSHLELSNKESLYRELVKLQALG